MATTPSTPSKSTIIQTIYENIYDRLVDNVTSVIITGGVTITIQTYTNSFPDKSLNKKSDYPIVVVSVPNLSWENLTMTKKWVIGRFSIEIYTAQSESADKFADAIANSIETYRDDLGTAGICFVNLDSMTYDEFTRGMIKVHNKTLNFSFKFNFTGSL